jgi:hypothetical protein
VDEEDTMTTNEPSMGTWQSLTGEMLTMQDVRSFDANVDRAHPSGCHIWTGPINENGYGVMRAGGCQRTLTAHRVAHVIHSGDIPAGAMILHSCDVRACVNPAHLRVGTAADNMRDAVERNRKRGRPSHDRSVEARVYLSPAEVAQIDALRGSVPRSEWMRERLLEAVRAPSTG